MQKRTDSRLSTWWCDACTYTHTHTHTYALTPTHTNTHALRKETERATICVFVQQRAPRAHAANAFWRMMARELLEINHCAPKRPEFSTVDYHFITPKLFRGDTQLFLTCHQHTKLVCRNGAHMLHFLKDHDKQTPIPWSMPISCGHQQNCSIEMAISRTATCKTATS